MCCIYRLWFRDQWIKAAFYHAWLPGKPESSHFLLVDCLVFMYLFSRSLILLISIDQNQINHVLLHKYNQYRLKGNYFQSRGLQCTLFCFLLLFLMCLFFYDTAAHQRVQTLLSVHKDRLKVEVFTHPLQKWQPIYHIAVDFYVILQKSSLCVGTYLTVLTPTV